MKNTDNAPRGQFASRFGVIAAAAGSAVGLGNIWKFPYEAGQNGGGAFIILYLAIMLTIGVSLIVAEFVIGRESRLGAVGSFRALAPGTRWRGVGLLGVAAAVLILSFYSTVAGWTLEYIRLSCGGAFAGLDSDAARGLFAGFTGSRWAPVAWQALFLALTAAIVLRGVEKGIEKWSKWLMPILLGMILLLCVRSLTLPGAGRGLEFLFSPDFSKIDSRTVLNALGQVFFSLSIGMGALITYGSYIPSKVGLAGAAAQISLADTLVALLAGVAIFPAVFSLGFSPDEGTGLVFIVLPQVFATLPGGHLFAAVFFVLLSIAALTSSISLLEITSTYLVEERGTTRRRGALLSTAAAALLGAACTLSFSDIPLLNTPSGNLFDLFSFVASDMILPVGGLLVVLFVGWRLPRAIVERQLGVDGQQRRPLWYRAFLAIVRYAAPAAILCVLAKAIVG